MRSNPDVGEKKLFLITSILALAECGTGLSTDAQKIITKKKVLLEVACPLCLLPTLTETFIDKKGGLHYFCSIEKIATNISSG